MNLITQNIQMTSLDLAELTSKNHSHIMRDIRDEIDQLGIIGKSIFGLGSYSDKKTDKKREFLLSFFYSQNFKVLTNYLLYIILYHINKRSIYE